jgi:flavodoxin
MKALVVYDSVFGNTEQIAQAIGNALGSQKDVEIRLSYPAVSPHRSNN